jgi:hypothetical protein
MRRSAIFLDSFLDGFTLAGFLRPLRRPGAATRLFAESYLASEEETESEPEHQDTVMRAILSLQAKQELLQAEIDVQAQSNEILKREIELLKGSGKAEYGASR